MTQKDKEELKEILISYARETSKQIEAIESRLEKVESPPTRLVGGQEASTPDLEGFQIEGRVKFNVSKGDVPDLEQHHLAFSKELIPLMKKYSARKLDVTLFKKF